MKNLLTLPKFELHLHLEGTLTPTMVFAKAQQNKIQLPYESITELEQAYQFKNLADFLALYYQNMQVLITEADFYDLTWAYLKTAQQENVQHVEVFFDPQAHLHRGITFSTIINGINKALIDGHKKLQISSKLIMCFLRDESPTEALEILALAKPAIEEKIIVGIGLDSSETEDWPKRFLPVFNAAKTMGLKTVTHAGEEKNDVNINIILDILKPNRIDHGLQSHIDPTILERLKKENIYLTLCPLSNCALQACPNLKDYPIATFLNHKISFGFNSDNPAYFGGGITANFITIDKIFNLSKETWLEITLNTVYATFLSKEEKQQYEKKVRNYFATQWVG